MAEEKKQWNVTVKLESGMEKTFSVGLCREGIAMDKGVYEILGWLNQYATPAIPFKWGEAHARIMCRWAYKSNKRMWWTEAAENGIVIRMIGGAAGGVRQDITIDNTLTQDESITRLEDCLAEWDGWGKS